MASESGISFRQARAPEGMRIYAVGDVHGCHDLLTEMHGRIMAEIMRDKPADWRIVLLGDYVDRGPASARVLEFLSRLARDEPRIVALGGNHDVGFLDFLARPSADGIFAGNGGDATARSYGVEMAFRPRAALLRGHGALCAAVPQAHADFLGNLELSASFGDLFFCHAGIRPGVPLALQEPDDLIWIRQRFLAHAGLHPRLVVHGHTPSPEPEILDNRVNLDTGAFRTGRLTAMMFEDREKRLLQVSQ